MFFCRAGLSTGSFLVLFLPLSSWSAPAATRPSSAGAAPGERATATAGRRTWAYSAATSSSSEKGIPAHMRHGVFANLHPLLIIMHPAATLISRLSYLSNLRITCLNNLKINHRYLFSLPSGLELNKSHEPINHLQQERPMWKLY